MSASGWAEKRWSARTGAASAEPVPITAQVAIAAAAESVWTLAWDPATSVLTDEAVTRAFTVPGTPAGQVGEIQCHVTTVAGGAQVGILSEVVEVEPGRRAVTRSLSQPGPDRSITEVAAIDQASCVLRVTYLTHGLDAATRAAMQAHAEQFAQRLRDIAEAARRSQRA